MNKIIPIFLILFGILLAPALSDCIGATTNFTCGDTITESCSLDENLTTDSTCFNINTNDITFDGNGYSILGTANNSIGIELGQINNTIIKNGIFESNLTDLKAEIFEGIKGTSGDGNTTIYNNTFLNNSRAIRLESFIIGANISNNELHDGEVAIILWGGDNAYENVIVANNNATNFNTSFYWNTVITIRGINENLKVYNNYVVSGYNPPVLEIYNDQNAEIYNNIFIGNESHQNVMMTFNASNNHVYNNTIISGTDGIFLTGSNNLIEQNIITQNIHHNIILYTHPSLDGDISNNIITNNNLEFAGINGIITADSGPGDIYNNTISYNNITNYGQTGISLDYIGVQYGTSDNTLIDHNFLSGLDGSYYQKTGIYATQDWDLKITNNIINDSDLNSLFYVSPYENRNLIVENNIFKGSYVYLGTTYGAIFNNNQILNGMEYGLLISGGGDNIISNNYINNTDGDGVMTGIGIELLDTGNNNITNTKVENSILYDIQGSVSQDNNLINCTFDSLDVIDDARIFVKWYLDVSVNDRFGKPVNGANVFIYSTNKNMTPIETFDSQFFTYATDPFQALGSGGVWSIVDNKLNGVGEYDYVSIDYLYDDSHYNSTYKKVETNFTFNDVPGYASMLLIIDLQDIGYNSGKYYSCWEQEWEGEWYLAIVRCNNLACTSYTTYPSSTVHLASLDTEYQMIFERNGNDFSCTFDGETITAIEDSVDAWAGGYEGVSTYYANITYDNTNITWNNITYVNIPYLNLEYNKITNSSGQIERQIITEYYKDSEGIEYYTPYVINSTTDIDMSSTESINITENYLLTLVLHSIPGNGGGKYSCEGGTICLILTETSNGLNNFFYYLSQNLPALLILLLLVSVIIGILTSVTYVISKNIKK